MRTTIVPILIFALLTALGWCLIDVFAAGPSVAIHVLQPDEAASYTNLNDNFQNLEAAVEGLGDAALCATGTAADTNLPHYKDMTDYVDTHAGATSAIPAKSYFEGMKLTYLSSTSVTISAGDGYCHGAYFNMTASQDYVVTSLTNRDEFYYIYIDDNLTAYPYDIVFTDSTNEPTETYDATHNGWYLGDDRVVGVVETTASVSEICNFKVADETFFRLRNVEIATNMNPNGAWQTPNIQESSATLPVNAKACFLKVIDWDSGANCWIAAAPKEVADDSLPYDGAFMREYGYDTVLAFSLVPLGTSRNVRIAGEDDDDNGSLKSTVNGWSLYR